MTNTLLTLPTDNLRQILWRFGHRADLQALVVSARQVARGQVARLVANGSRSTNEWTPGKSEVLEIFDRTGITAAFMGCAPTRGAYATNLARALIAFELAWVDAGAATSLLAGSLAFSAISGHGTTEQQQRYLNSLTGPGAERNPWRGAFCLTEPIPYVGSDATVLGGKIRIANWEPRQDPALRVQKDGRYITNMGFANVVVAAVESDDARIRGSCMIILEEGDPGVFDRGVPTRKLAHQLSSTSDPRFDVRVPANRILGGYSVQDGVVAPNFSHGEIIEPVIKRSRVIVGLLTSAKLVSAVEPLIRYHRERFRGAAHSAPETPRHELGLQQHPDVVYRVVDIWAAGEAGASLGFAAARLFDMLDPLEEEVREILAESGSEARGRLRVPKATIQDAIKFLETKGADKTQASTDKSESADETLTRFALHQAEANLFAPAVKLWNTGSVAMLREAVSLMGGYGVTEDCPGFLGYKWVDAQLEATYEGPEALQRRALAAAMTQELFPALWKGWIDELQKLGTERRAGARCLAASMELWLWTFDFLQRTSDEAGGKLFRSQRQEICFPLADALSWLLAARQFALDVDELGRKTSGSHPDAGDLSGMIHLYDDLCHTQAARAASEAARICGELVVGYLPPSTADKLPDEIADFHSLRLKLDSYLAGSQFAKRRAAKALTAMVIPDALDYPR